MVSKKLWSVALVAAVLAAPQSATATTIRVPANKPTIQEGINAAASYDTVLVAPGCCDFYGNDEGNWVNNNADMLGVDGNTSADPLFCDFGGGSYYLRAFSPCRVPHRRFEVRHTTTNKTAPALGLSPGIGQSAAT
jgi:hypothetical protein